MWLHRCGFSHVYIDSVVESGKVSFWYSFCRGAWIRHLTDVHTWIQGLFRQWRHWWKSPQTKLPPSQCWGKLLRYVVLMKWVDYRYITINGGSIWVFCSSQIMSGWILLKLSLSEIVLSYALWSTLLKLPWNPLNSLNSLNPLTPLKSFMSFLPLLKSCQPTRVPSLRSRSAIAWAAF